MIYIKFKVVVIFFLGKVIEWNIKEYRDRWNRIGNLLILSCIIMFYNVKGVVYSFMNGLKII